MLPTVQAGRSHREAWKTAKEETGATLPCRQKTQARVPGTRADMGPTPVLLSWMLTKSTFPCSISPVTTWILSSKEPRGLLQHPLRLCAQPTLSGTPSHPKPVFLTKLQGRSHCSSTRLGRQPSTYKGVFVPKTG